MHYTIYKVTNQQDGKIYIGSHKTRKLDDKYMGSGKYLKRAMAKYGVENFTKEVLHVFDTPEEMFAKEAELVNEDFLATANTYNLKKGGFGGFDYINSLNLSHRKENGRRFGQLHKRRLEDDPIYRERSRTALLSGLDIARKKGSWLTSGFLGKKHSAETIQKMKLSAVGNQTGSKNSQYGTKWITDGIQSTRIQKLDAIPDGWVSGRTMRRT